MSDITAKVKCNTKKEWYGTPGAAFEFVPDYADGRNKEWASATPTLALNISVKDGEMFEVGKSYTLTFSEGE